MSFLLRRGDEDPHDIEIGDAVEGQDCDLCDQVISVALQGGGIPAREAALW